MSEVICRSSESKGSWYSLWFGGGVKGERSLKQTIKWKSWGEEESTKWDSSSWDHYRASWIAMQRRQPNSGFRKWESKGDVRASWYFLTPKDAVRFVFETVTTVNLFWVGIKSPQAKTPLKEIAMHPARQEKSKTIDKVEGVFQEADDVGKQLSLTTTLESTRYGLH